MHPELTFANHGVYGQRTDEIAQRFDDAVAGAEVLIVQGGIDDIAQGRSIDDAAANLAGLVDRGLALGSALLSATSCPGTTPVPHNRTRSRI